MGYTITRLRVTVYVVGAEVEGNVAAEAAGR
jgi:hypothetical protein